MATSIRRYVNDAIVDDSFDLIWVDHGDLCSRKLIRDLRRYRTPIVNYCQDNPYVSRDGHRWRLFRSAIPEYDLVVTPRESSVVLAKDAGARKVARVMFAADEVVHRARTISEVDENTFKSRVSFIGTWMPERGAFLESLIDMGVPLTIFGPRWERAPEYRRLTSHIRLGELSPDDDYVKAIQCSSIAIGLLSKGNEDLHTTRSLEIPSIGTVLCAQRTSEHLIMYEEDREALFFDDAKECARKCMDLLSDPSRLAQTARAGHLRALRNGYFNENLFLNVVTQLGTA
ncbi:glycosyltransferase [Bradyrhizobium sp. Ec3.3]|uniref:CgeB family protein n=1 Tax=Bradyrhizobium sp. Ec3.3 TaxID=189753 RepID=UPI0018DB80F7|nr:glycosyltransferase [Bradyrhizobium sp. Ec3.3]